MNLPVDIFRIHPDALIPKYQTPGSCAFDMAPIEDAVIQPGEIVRLKTGLVICVPDGYTLLIAARSSLPKKYKLCVPQGVGIVDMDYCGPEDELLIQLLNFSSESVEIKKGQRLAQGMFVPINQVQFKEVEKLDGPSRGGYGSTG